MIQVIKAVAATCLAAGLTISCYPLYVNKLPLVPLWVAVTAKRNAPRVQVGMTDT